MSVGLLALQAEGYAGVRPYPLDWLDAQTEGMLGYVIERVLRNQLGGRPVASLLTQVEVDAADPAFRRPSKPIGPIYTQVEATAGREAAIGALDEAVAVARGERGTQVVPV